MAAQAGSSMEGIAGRGAFLLKAAADKGNTVSHSGLIHKKPKKLQHPFENAFSVGNDKSLFSSLIPHPQMKTCHHCGLFGSLRCSQCKQIHYCSVGCQKKDWPAHRVVCEPVKQNGTNNNGGKLPARIEKRVSFKGNSTSVGSLKTGEHIKKIMLSDLQTLRIKKAMEVQGTITEFKSPCEFYIQMTSPEVLNQICKLSLKLQDYYANTVIQEQYIAVKGEVCAARCTLDQTWNRALVKDLDISQEKARVFYIDYGNEENIPLSSVKPLHKDTELLFPPCAIKCSFANYDPKEKGWSEGIDNISSQLIGKHCSVTVVDILQEEMMLNFAVDVVVPGFGDCLDKVSLEIGSDLTPGSNAKRADCSEVSEKHSKGSKEKIPEDEEFLYFGNSVAVWASACTGDVFSGVVSSVQNPENFFCQQMHSARQLADLQVSLNEHYGKSPSSPAFHPTAGTVCCAQFTEDNLWYRAAVIQCVSEDTVLVGYIDYGNFEVLPLTRLRPVIPRLMDLPAQAIRCTLAGVKPPSGAWTSKAISFMNQLVKDKVLTVKVMDKETDRSVVELVDASVTPVINISSHLIEKGFATEESRMALTAIGMGEVKPANDALWPGYGHYLSLFRRVSGYFSPFLNFSHQVEAFEHRPFPVLCDSCFPPLCHYSVSQPRFPRVPLAQVIATYSVPSCEYSSLVIDSLPFSGVIRYINQQAHFSCFYFAEALTEYTANKKIYKWSKLTLKQTVDVIVCELCNPGEFYCQILNNSELLALKLLNKSLSAYCQKTPPNVFKPVNEEPCCAFFSDDGNWYRALVKNVASDGTVRVCFVDYGNVEEVPLDKIRQISSSFLKLPFQGIKCWLSGIKPGNSEWIPEATARFRMYATGKKLQARVTSLSRDGAGVELIDNSTGHPKVINEILTSEKLAVKEVLQDKSNFPDKSDEKESSLANWKLIELAIDETVFVCVTEIVSPDLFYAVPVQIKDQEKLHRLFIELDSYCKSCENQPFKPKLGEACCARFSGDGHWYRALVLQIYQSAVKVLYADYGNTKTLPLSEVLPITDSYLKLPFQTIMCSLAGIKKAEWTPLLFVKMREMLLNKYFTITVKGINENVNLVTVEELCVNGSLNVADKLVVEGLVKSRGAENLHTEHQGNGVEAKCCCTELKMELKRHEQMLLFLLNKYENMDGFTEMKKPLHH